MRRPKAASCLLLLLAGGLALGALPLAMTAPRPAQAMARVALSQGESVVAESGAMVGMSTNIPPHNLRELCDALTLLVPAAHRLEELPGLVEPLFWRPQESTAPESERELLAAVAAAR